MIRTFILLILLVIGTTPLYAQNRRDQARKPATQARRSTTTRLLKIDGKYQYVRGMNLAWLNGCYRHDFGHSPAHRDWGVGFNANSLDRYFEDMARMNVNVVRIFVCEDLEGLNFDGKGYTEGMEREMSENFDTALMLAKKHGLHLYLCLGNNYHDVCKEINVPDIICNVKARQAYLNNVVKPFVARYKGDKGVFAFDILNEPQFDLHEHDASGSSWTSMRSFLRDNATAIHNVDPTRLVSVGVGSSEIRDGYVFRLGLNFYNVHNYDDNGALPTVASLNVNLPVIVGEFGPTDNNHSQDDNVQKRATENFLRNARDGGYAGAAYWAYEFPQYPTNSNLPLLRSGGSDEWRPAAYVIRDFQWTRK